VQHRSPWRRSSKDANWSPSAACPSASRVVHLAWTPLIRLPSGRLGLPSAASRTTWWLVELVHLRRPSVATIRPAVVVASANLVYLLAVPLDSSRREAMMGAGQGPLPFAPQPVRRRLIPKTTTAAASGNDYAATAAHPHHSAPAGSRTSTPTRETLGPRSRQRAHYRRPADSLIMTMDRRRRTSLVRGETVMLQP
jgi:hypothetical protein